MTKLNNRLLMGLAVTVSLVAALTIVHAQRANVNLPPQGGSDSPQRQTVQNAPKPAAPGFQTCASNVIGIDGPTPTGLVAFVVLPAPTVVTLTFSTEILAPVGGTVNVDYSIDGNPPVPIGPEFFADDSRFFVTRTAHAATIPPFTDLLPAGLHTIEPVLTAFGGNGAADFRCFTAVP